MNRKGSVLIIVLWSLFLLSMLAVAVHAYVMPYPELASKLIHRTKMGCFANAGVERAIFEVENNDRTDTYDSACDSWSSDPSVFDHVAIDGGTFSAVKDVALSGAKPQYGLTDEEGKININKASQQVLKNLFEKVAHAEPEDADAIADSIIDWRDADDSPRKRGKENGYYRFLEHPYDCKNSDFETKEELLLVAGVLPEMFEKIKDSITLYGEGMININTAGIPVLLSLGLDDPLAGKIVRFRAKAGLKKNEESPEGVFTDASSVTDRLDKAEHLSGDEIAQMQRVVSLLGVKSDNFRGNIIGACGDGTEMHKIEFVYDRKERLVKYWREK